MRLAYAATNEQPYHERRPLAAQTRGLIRDGTWPGIKAWVLRNPQRVQEMLWANPRVVFFREEPLGPQEAVFGPRGAQGVALTPGRSIAVDPKSIPYGTPVWLASAGPDREPAEARARAGHWQRDHRAGARRLLRGLGHAGGGFRRAAEAAAQALGAVAALTPDIASLLLFK